MSRPEASAAVSGFGWRLVLGTFQASVPVESLPDGVEVAAVATSAAGADAGEHVRIDVRLDRVVLTLQTLNVAALTTRDVEIAESITAAVTGSGRRIGPHTRGDAARSVQNLEIAIDAMDIPSIRPFWMAVLGYSSEPGYDGPEDPLVDPVGQGPAVWFQQMDQPRPQRNRIHLDVSVPHDEAQRRVHAALAAGGRLVSDRRAPAFWVLADPEGNEACITTWQGRD